MKKLIVSIATIITLAACSENFDLNTASDIDSGKTRALSSQTFSFDSITKPEVWRSFQTLEEMQSA